MSDLLPVAIAFTFGLGLILAARLGLNPLPRPGEKALISERRATLHNWAMHFGASAIFCSGFILAAPVVMPESRMVAGALVGVAASVLGSAVSSLNGGSQRRTDGWVEQHPFLTSILVNGAFGATLSLLTTTPAL